MADQMTRDEAAELLRSLSGHKVAVIGDLFLDEYLVGNPERLSREGPVPVLAFNRRFCRPGGAANPAWNIAALGSTAVQIGVTGSDEHAAELRNALAESGIVADGVVSDTTRPTTVKTRIVSEGTSVGQQVARIDRQSREPLAPEVERGVLRALEQHAADADAILVSHYRSGVVTPVVCDAARALAAGRGLLLSADAQGDIEWFTRFHVVRVGRGDAAAALGRSLAGEPDYEVTATALRRELGCDVFVLGRGAAGMSVADSNGYALFPPANVSEVYDVSGAGDTVIAMLTLARVAKVPVRSAVLLANVAAGISVRRLGVAAPTVTDILSEFDRLR